MKSSRVESLSGSETTTVPGNDNAHSCQGVHYSPGRKQTENDAKSNECEREFDAERGEHVTRNKCAAAEECVFKSHSTPATHSCGIRNTPVHNLCEYGKRVERHFSREDIFSCSKNGYELEGRDFGNKKCIVLKETIRIGGKGYEEGHKDRRMKTRVEHYHV